MVTAQRRLSGALLRTSIDFGDLDLRWRIQAPPIPKADLCRADALRCSLPGAQRRLAIPNQELLTDTLLGILKMSTALFSATGKNHLVIWMCCNGQTMGRIGFSTGRSWQR
jgi:hypothetical protein